MPVCFVCLCAREKRKRVKGPFGKGGKEKEGWPEERGRAEGVQKKTNMGRVSAGDEVRVGEVWRVQEF